MKQNNDTVGYVAITVMAALLVIGYKMYKRKNNKHLSKFYSNKIISNYYN